MHISVSPTGLAVYSASAKIRRCVFHGVICGVTELGTIGLTLIQKSSRGDLNRSSTRVLPYLTEPEQSATFPISCGAKVHRNPSN